MSQARACRHIRKLWPYNEYTEPCAFVTPETRKNCNNFRYATLGSTFRKSFSHIEIRAAGSRKTAAYRSPDAGFGLIESESPHSTERKALRREADLPPRVRREFAVRWSTGSAIPPVMEYTGRVVLYDTWDGSWPASY